MEHRLDGIQARSAMCDRCGYHLGGIPFKNGMVICPECGHSVAFDFRPRKTVLRSPDRVRAFFTWTVGVLLVAAFGVISGSIVIAVVAASAWVFVAIGIGILRRRCFEV